MRWVRYVLLLALLLLAVSFPLARQVHNAKTGSIEGMVVDETGAPIAQAMVQACNIMRGGFSTAYSQSNGVYRIAELSPGRYSLWARARAHSAVWIPMVIVEEGQDTRRDIQLQREGPIQPRPTASH
jgi:protocatechuate 3,4-dioxygenase beta subunit